MNTTPLVPFLLGTFSGFLSTFPTGPAKILALRNFLLISEASEEEIAKLQSSRRLLLASISGLICAQSLYLVASWFPLVYSLWVRPHFFSLLFVPALLFYLVQLKSLQFNIYGEQTFYGSKFNLRHEILAFGETFLFQLLNPIVLPNPVFCRLTDISLFRYPTSLSFFFGNLSGLISGYGIFFLFTLSLLKRLELDSLTVYRVLKRRIQQLFGIVLVVFSFICISKMPLPAIKPFLLEDPTSKPFFTRSNSESTWPDSFFGYNRFKRPLRLLECDIKRLPSDEKIKPFNQMLFSQFFFAAAKKDGSSRLYHNFPKNLSKVYSSLDLFQTMFSAREDDHSQPFMNKWINDKKERLDRINKDINFKITQIEKGIPVEELLEKKRASLDDDEKFLSKPMDPRLSTNLRGTSLLLNNRSFLFLTNENLTKNKGFSTLEEKTLLNRYTKNKLKQVFTKNNEILGSLEKAPPVLGTPLHQVYSKTSLKTRMLWERIKKLISHPFSVEFVGAQKRVPLQLGEDSFEIEMMELDEFKDGSQNGNSRQLALHYKPMALWSQNLNKKALKDLQLKLQNGLRYFFPQGELIEDQQYFVPPLQRSFRRSEYPGTIRARRGKALAWNTLQEEPHAPFFVSQLKLLHNFFEEKRGLQVGQEKTTRPWRTNLGLLCFLRNWCLYIQAKIRKGLKFPVLIILKNLTRLLFLQPGEWEQDWANLAKEDYVECDLYGRPLPRSTGLKLPEWNFSSSQQIKIINPFQLRFWTRANSKNLSEHRSSSFLNVWGQEIRTPFGKAKQYPSFWKLFRERIRLLVHYKIIKQFSFSTYKSSKGVEKQSLGTLESKNKSQESSLILKTLIDQHKLVIQPEKIEEDQTKKFNTDSNYSIEAQKGRKVTIRSPQGAAFSFSEKKEKRDRRRTYNVNNLSLLCQKQSFSIYRSYLKKQRHVIFYFKKYLFEYKKWFIRKNKEIQKIFLQLLSRFSTFFSLFVYRVLEFLTFWQSKSTKDQMKVSSSLENSAHKDTRLLSQAYVLHKIWEDRMMNRPNMTPLMKIWNENNTLKENLQKFLKEHGIIENQRPDTLAEYQWKEWLAGLRGFTPPLELWSLCSPDSWRAGLEQYWKDCPNNDEDSILTSQRSKKDNNSQSTLEKKTLVFNKFLESHTPLFEGAKKEKRLWTLNLISRNYTEVLNDGDIDSFLMWNPKNFDRKTDYLFYDNKRKKRSEKAFLTNATITSSLPKLRETKLKVDNTQEHDGFSKELLPLAQRENEYLAHDTKLQTLEQRISFFPTSIQRGRLRRLKTKLRKFASNVIKESQGREFSSYSVNGQKDQNIFRKILQSKSKATILESWDSKLLDDELFMYSILSSTLKFENRSNNFSFDSENMKNKNEGLSSFFSKKRRLNSSACDLIFLEDIYLPISLREIRILNSLSFHDRNSNVKNRDKTFQSSKNSESEGTQYSQNKKVQFKERSIEWRLLRDPDERGQFEPHWAKKERQMISRFIWPRHRLEDLSCINRFWMGTANQGRFSPLRINSIVSL